MYLTDAAGYAISKPILSKPVCHMTQYDSNYLKSLKKRRQQDSHSLASSSMRNFSTNGHCRCKFNDSSKYLKEKVAVHNSEQNFKCHLEKRKKKNPQQKTRKKLFHISSLSVLVSKYN